MISMPSIWRFRETVVWSFGRIGSTSGTFVWSITIKHHQWGQKTSHLDVRGEWPECPNGPKTHNVSRRLGRKQLRYLAHCLVLYDQDDFSYEELSSGVWLLSLE